jgi:hypothetical protein
MSIIINIKPPSTPKVKIVTKPVTVKKEDDDDDDVPKFLSKPKKEKPKPEFIVSDEYGNFFCGYRHAYPYWCDKISEAKELSEQSHFDALVRWHKHKKLKQEFL